MVSFVEVVFLCGYLGGAGCDCPILCVVLLFVASHNSISDLTISYESRFGICVGRQSIPLVRMGILA